MLLGLSAKLIPFSTISVCLIFLFAVVVIFPQKIRQNTTQDHPFCLIPEFLSKTIIKTNLAYTNTIGSNKHFQSKTILFCFHDFCPKWDVCNFVSASELTMKCTIYISRTAIFGFCTVDTYFTIMSRCLLNRAIISLHATLAEMYRNTYSVKHFGSRKS